MFSSVACENEVFQQARSGAADHPVDASCSVFRYARVEHPEDLPPANDRTIDVAVLDMNHGWPNLGHDSLVHCVLDATRDLLHLLEGAGLCVRAVSFAVRDHVMLPEWAGGRFGLYVGSGGPGHLDPRLNQPAAEGSQGLDEDSAWEPSFFGLIESIMRHDQAALLAVCHTFGVLCRWSGTAEITLRGADKDGKSTGIVQNLLTPQARDHPWFGRFAEELPRDGRLWVVDNRLYDLVPKRPLPSGTLAIGHETLGIGGPAGNALTMVEFARDKGGVMPRVFGVNHHPEILDRERQLMLLDRKRQAEGNRVPAKWYEERRDILTRTFTDDDCERRLRRTSEYTLLKPLGFHLHRLVRQRADSLGQRVELHEDHLLEESLGAAVGVGQK